jgi:flagellar motor switch protein FliN/FliY
MTDNDAIEQEMPATPPPAPKKKGAAAPAPSGDGGNLDLLMDVSLAVTVELGRTRMPLRQVLELQNGSVIELDRLAGDAVDIFVNDRLIARGEVVVVDDKFGVRITELLTNPAVKA